ncbi:MAG: penicillin-binding transpeptidase domain-containing protein [Faecalibacterium sp.]
MDERKQVTRRIFLLMIGGFVLLWRYLLRLISLQLINGKEYLAKATSTSSYTFEITAARGDIVDCHGTRLATSSTYYNAVLNKLLLGDADLNSTLQEMCEILQASNETWEDPLLISAPDLFGNYTFTSSGSDSDEASLASVKEALSLQQYATAENIMDALVDAYDLASYSLEWQRILAGIRYRMVQLEFSNSNNFTLSESVSDKTVATIKERSLTLQGIEIVETSVRSYPDGTVLPHVLGRVSKITAEQWYVEDEDGNITRPLAQQGYAMDDTIGISGLESAYETILRGTDGELEVTKDADGIIIDNAVTVQPQPGTTVMTTINADLQVAVNEILATNIASIAANNIEGAGAEACAGAVVVVDIKTGGVLAVANYPSYDQNLYSSNYSEYASDPATPLYNRALMGLYTPGSTFKPGVAASALMNGVITAKDTVYCGGTYTYYSDYQPTCTRYGHSGSINVVTALQWSCNIFFYDVGRRLGSEAYNATAYSLGLGNKTGVEVAESSGRLTTMEDSNYTNSLEIQAAIGQGNTVVTPLQMATYAASIANGGVRYQTHFVKALLDTNSGEVLEEYDPVIMETLEDTVGAFDTVQQGMMAAANTIASFASYPYTIASKTGSPQRSETYTNSSGTRKYYTNSALVAYAPVEAPEIAVSTIIEYGGGGSKAAPLVAQVFDAYFFGQAGTSTPVTEEQLLE